MAAPSEVSGDAAVKYRAVARSEVSAPKHLQSKLHCEATSQAEAYFTRRQAHLTQKSGIRKCEFIATMEQTQTVPVAFDADLWLATVDRVTVHKDTVVFIFKGGMEITEEI